MCKSPYNPGQRPRVSALQISSRQGKNHRPVAIQISKQLKNQYHLPSGEVWICIRLS